jgi:hypothetical protein
MFKKLAALLPVLALTLTGCAVDMEFQDDTTPSVSQEATTLPAEAPTAEGVISVETVTKLNELVVADEAHDDTYSQDEFKFWVRKNDTGCDTRFAVLKRDSLSGFTANKCDITGGEWFSSYDALTVTDASKLDIDHMVPRSEAWRSGASEWTADERESFANDLSNPATLVAVSASSNRSKSDNDPSKWMPATDACIYLTNWVDVKHQWKLTVDATEKTKIVSTMSFCAMDEATAALLPDVTNVVNSDGSIPGAAVAPSTPAETAAPVEAGTDGNDPRFDTCADVKKNGYGPYTQGTDAEYDWYRDGNSDGITCT